MPRKPKSCYITILLGPKEVEAILKNPDGWGSKERGIAVKLSEAVAKKFSYVAEVMDEVTKAVQICHGMCDSVEWKELGAGFAERRAAIHKQEDQLHLEETQAMENLVQSAFDKAGITHFVAKGWGFQRIEPSEV